MQPHREFVILSAVGLADGTRRGRNPDILRGMRSQLLDPIVLSEAQEVVYDPDWIVGMGSQGADDRERQQCSPAFPGQEQSNVRPEFSSQ